MLGLDLVSSSSCNYFAEPLDGLAFTPLGLPPVEFSKPLFFSQLFS